MNVSVALVTQSGHVILFLATAWQQQPFPGVSSTGRCWGDASALAQLSASLDLGSQQWTSPRRLLYH